VSDADVLACAQQVVGHTFHDPELLRTSLTHASVADHRLVSNERLEFLGDAVLGVIICEELYRRYAGWLEGELTKVKSVVVSRRVCAEVADELGLTRLLILGSGIDAQSNLPSSLKAAVFEAIIGALYVDGGLEAAQRFVLQAVAGQLARHAASEDHDNFKSALQQYAQRWLSATPEYRTLDEQGPDHSKCFEVCVLLDGERFPSAWGPSKKTAEQEAAKRALEVLQKRRAEHPQSTV